MQKYLLRRQLLNPGASIEIAHQEYEALSLARKTLDDALAFEQKFELLLGNYKDFELAGARWSLSRTVESRFDYQSGADILMDANRLVVNFLATARLYVDQVARVFSHLDLREPFKTTVKERLSNAYDASFEYRFMAALRNHVQHRTTPIHRLGGRQVKREKTEEWADLYTAWVLKANLQDEGDFKATVLDEMPEEVDLRLAIRAYVTQIAEIHLGLRAYVDSRVRAARSLIEGTIQRYERETNLSASRLHACYSNGGGQEDEYTGWVLLLLAWDDVRKALVLKNQGLRILVSPIGESSQGEQGE